MSATVVDLTSRIRNRPPACGCPHHLLESLVTRSAAEFVETEGQLLVDREIVAALIDAVTTTVRAALAPQHGKTNP